MLPVSLDCKFLIAHSVFSNVYLTTTLLMILWHKQVGEDIHPSLVVSKESKRSCICVLGLSSQEGERSCICVLGLLRLEGERSCICVLGLSNQEGGASYLKRYVTFSISTKPELLLTDLRPMDILNDTTAL
jgi:hypothetical protein